MVSSKQLLKRGDTIYALAELYTGLGECVALSGGLGLLMDVKDVLCMVQFVCSSGPVVLNRDLIRKVGD